MLKKKKKKSKSQKAAYHIASFLESSRQTKLNNIIFRQMNIHNKNMLMIKMKFRIREAKR